MTDDRDLGGEHDAAPAECNSSSSSCRTGSCAKLPAESGWTNDSLIEGNMVTGAATNAAARGSRSPARGTVSSPTGLEHDGRWHPAIRDSEGRQRRQRDLPTTSARTRPTRGSRWCGGKRHSHLESERAPQSLLRPLGSLEGLASGQARPPLSDTDGSVVGTQT
jgi:hypothetical protein